MFDFREVLKKFQDSASYIQECRDKDLNLLIGLTGSGKTTVLNALLGEELVKKGDGTVDRIKSPVRETGSPRGYGQNNNNVPVTPQHAATIGHGAESQTSHPTLYHEAERNCFLLDCAGFGDTRTDEDRVSISLAMESALRNAASINTIFVVINYNDLLAERGKSIKRLANMMMSLFSKLEEATKSLYFVFTHLDSLRNEILFNKLRESEDSDIQLTQMALENSVESELNTRLLSIINNIISTLERTAQGWSPAKLTAMGRYGLGAVGSSMLNTIGFGNGNNIDINIGQDNYFKDANNHYRSLLFFKLIQKALNEKVALFFNVSDKQHLKIFRDRFLDVIQTTKRLQNPIPYQSFNFTEYDRQRAKFESELRAGSWKFLQLLSELNQIPQEMSNIEAQIQHLRRLIENNTKKLDESGDDAVQRLGQIQILLDEQQVLITAKQDQINVKIRERESCEEQLRGLESDDLIPVSYFFEEKRWNIFILPYFLGYSSHVFEVTHSDGVIENFTVNAVNGSARVLTEDKKAGKLSLTYSSGYGLDAQCTLTVFYRTRFFRNNPTQIQDLKTQIAEINGSIDGLRGELHLYQAKFEALKNTHQGNELTIENAKHEIRSVIQLYAQGIRQLDEKKGIFTQRLVVLRRQFEEYRELIVMMDCLMSECKALKDEKFLMAHRLFNSSHQSIPAPIALDVNEFPSHYRSQFSDKVMTTPIRFQTCAHIVDYEEFELEAKDLGVARCPCCIKLGKTTVYTGKNDLSMFVMMHDLAREIVVFKQSKLLGEIMEPEVKGDQDQRREQCIDLLRAKIREKQAELIYLERELAALIELPKPSAKSADHFDEESDSNEEGQRSILHEEESDVNELGQESIHHDPSEVQSPRDNADQMPREFAQPIIQNANEGELRQDLSQAPAQEPHPDPQDDLGRADLDPQAEHSVVRNLNF